MGYSYTRARRVFHRQLRRFGGPASDQALLIRGNQTRKCRAARNEWRPHERGLHEEGSSRILISAKSLQEYGSAAPDMKLDKIYFARALYSIVEPILGPRQDDPTIIYYECAVVYLQAAAYLIGTPTSISMQMGIDFETLFEEVT